MDATKNLQNLLYSEARGGAPTKAELEAASASLAGARQEAAKDEGQIPRLLQQLMVVAYLRRRQNDDVRAQSLIREAAARLGEMRQPPTGIALQIHAALAFCFESTGRRVESAPHYKQAIAFALQAGCMKTELGAALCWNYGALCQHLGDELGSLEYSKKAEQILASLAASPAPATAVEHPPLPVANPSQQPQRPVMFKLNELFLSSLAAAARPGAPPPAAPKSPHLSPPPAASVHWSVQSHRPVAPPRIPTPNHGEAAQLFRRTRGQRATPEMGLASNPPLE